MTDITSLPISELSRCIHSGETGPVEVTEAYLARIERLNPDLNAYVTVTAERAREDARRAADEIAKGVDKGPLHGIPIGLKDLYETAGIRTTGGSIIHKDYVPVEDCPAAARLREAGTVLLGKLNTHEFAWGVTTNNKWYGPTRNPWNRECIPGGSSGGSGAAIAAGLAAGTLGSDTGGSIRIPAALCGCVGLKPTYGRVPKRGVMPMSYLWDHAGPITTTVEDAALMLQVIAGYDPFDGNSTNIPVPDFRASMTDGVKGLRIGVPRGFFFENLHPDVASATEAAIQAFRDLGADVHDVDIAINRDSAQVAWSAALAETHLIHGETYAARPEDFGPDLHRMLDLPIAEGRAVIASLLAADQFRVAFQSAMVDVDLLLTPTCPLPAAKIGAETVTLPDGKDVPIGAFAMLTMPYNVTRQPVLSLPSGFSREGLPLSISLAARHFEEPLLIQAGHAYEQAAGWSGRRPAL